MKLLLLLSALSLGAAPTKPAAPATPATLADIQKQLTPFQVVSGKFTQSKKIKIITQPLVSSGAFVLAKGKGLLWHTEKPFDATLRITQAGIAELDHGKVNTLVSTQAQPGMQQVGELLFAVFSGDLKALGAHFTFDAIQAPPGAPWSAVLRPRDPQVAKFVTSIALRGQKTMHGLTLVEANGDTTEIAFDAVVVDAKLTPAQVAQFE